MARARLCRHDQSIRIPPHRRHAISAVTPGAYVIGNLDKGVRPQPVSLLEEVLVLLASRFHGLLHLLQTFTPLWQAP